MERSRMAASRTERANGPAWSREDVNAAGWRIEPPVSVPVAPRQRFAATAAAEPPEEPPGTSGALAPRRRHGDCTGPKCELSLDEPMANSSLLVLPSSTAPSRHSCAV